MDYQASDILQDIKNYIKAGCRPLAYEPGYLADVRNIIGDDFSRMVELLNQSQNRVFLLEMRKYVDRERSTKKVRAFDDEKLWHDAAKVFGEETAENLSKLDVSWRTDDAVHYGQMMHDVGKNAMGDFVELFIPIIILKMSRWLLWGQMR